MTDRALHYCRTSGDDTDRDSMSAQDRVCTEYSKNKGYTIISESPIKDDVKGVSGASFNAQGLTDALELAKSGRFDVLVIRDVSRLARDLEKFVWYEPRFKATGVRIEFVWQNFEDSPTGRFYKTMSVGVAQLEKDLITMRLHAGIRDKVKTRKSMIVNGNPPFGYKVKYVKSTGRWTPSIVQEEAEIIKEIFRLYVVEDKSLHAIAKRLTELGVPTYVDMRADQTTRKKKRGYGFWSASMVRFILQNEVYAGVWRYGKSKLVMEREFDRSGNPVEKSRRVPNDESKIIEIPVPEIVSREIWDKAKVKLKQNAKRRGRHPGYEYLLSKRVKCDCGSTMGCSHTTSGDGYEYFYYLCMARAEKKGCKMPRANARDVDNKVWEWFANLLRDREKLKSRFENYRLEAEKELKPLRHSIAITEKSLDEAKEEYDKLMKLYLKSDEFEQSLLEEPKSLLVAKIKELQGHYEKLVEKEWDIEHTLEMMESDTRNSFYEYLGLYDMMETQETGPTYEQKLDLLRRFNVQVILSADGKDIWATAKCDVGEGFLQILNTPSNAISP